MLDGRSNLRYNPVVSKFRDKILQEAGKYYQESEGDFSHDINHFLRVEKLVKKIGADGKADLDVLEAAALLFDVARILEDRGEVEEHAEAGSQIAREILTKIGFPKEKIDLVCRAILVHRKSMNKEPETLEAKILQDADYLDALGAIDVARILGSSFQSKKYKRPIYDGKPSDRAEDNNKSAINYLLYKISQPKMQPENFHTRLGREYAKERFTFVKEFARRFIAEWEGKE